ncbi:exopolysaccharide repeat unit polymerase [Vitiosangium sp. GDMCC 1.1324]|uniref:exopolysaccharide repeat unit polymerase n=1 Tax=Vitiosangium sp. (strain GDMCC 1.1324) TaxID=2138576 RepID=UPI000D33E40B|nr:exopolysaccharide repeat unit polymerase [Vitiosangium sp. GDMCC 1.1324]PTL75773.1 polymerase [Vitiosangium sp. GDMCC 1.1324]
MQAFLSRTPVFMTLLALLVLATVGLVIAAPAIAILPVAGAAFLWWVCHQPLRTLTFAIFAMAVTVDLVPEVPYEGKWQSPLYFPGKLIFTMPGMSLPLMDLAVVGLIGLMIYRRATGMKIDPPPLPLPKPVVIAMLVVPATILWMQVWGIYINGGEARVARWQWHQMMSLPLMVMCFNSAVRGPKDFHILGRIIVVACCTKAILGAWFIVMIARPRGYYFEYATTHSDSMLYVTGLACVIWSWMEQPTRKHFWRMVWVVSIIMMGMHYNDRRLGYASFQLSLIFGYFISPWSGMKRKLTRVALLLLPLFPFYVAVGWANPSGIFAPVGIFKSMLVGENLAKGQMDYRDIENLDDVHTWNRNPILGSGWGHPFDEVIKLPDISHAFADYLYHPHNSVLGLLAFGGVVGFSGLWMWIPIAVFLAVRAYHRAHEPLQRAGGLVALSVFVAYTQQCFGDMGSISWLGALLAAMAITCASQLSVVTNAWPASQPRRNEVSEPENSRSPVGNLV